MQIKKSLMGISLSTAVALAFSAVPIVSAFSDTHGVECFGINACKGQSACKTLSNACKGQNSCKGKGYLVTKTRAECAKAGGSTSDPASGSTSGGTASNSCKTPTSGANTPE